MFGTNRVRMYWLVALSTACAVSNLATDKISMLENEAVEAIQKVQELKQASERDNSYLTRPSIHIPRHFVSTHDRR